jgi:hypothetical protein
VADEVIFGGVWQECMCGMFWETGRNDKAFNHLCGKYKNKEGN